MTYSKIQTPCRGLTTSRPGLLMMVCRVSQDFLALQERKVVKESLAFQAFLGQWIQICWAQKERKGTLDYQVSECIYLNFSPGVYEV